MQGLVSNDPPPCNLSGALNLTVLHEDEELHGALPTFFSGDAMLIIMPFPFAFSMT